MACLILTNTKRLNDFATSLRKMTQEAETCRRFPIKRITYRSLHRARLSLQLLTAPTRTDEEKDRKKLIEAQDCRNRQIV